MSEPWREHFRHAVREAGRLGLKMSVNLCSGWNAGGPWVQLDDAIKHLVTAEITVQGPAKLDRMLPQPPCAITDWYRDIAVLACRIDEWTGLETRGDDRPDGQSTQDGRLRWDVPDGSWTILRSATRGRRASRLRRHRPGQSAVPDPNRKGGKSIPGVRGPWTGISPPLRAS